MTSQFPRCDVANIVSHVAASNILMLRRHLLAVDVATWKIDRGDMTRFGQNLI